MTKSAHRCTPRLWDFFVGSRLSSRRGARTIRFRVCAPTYALQAAGSVSFPSPATKICLSCAHFRTLSLVEALSSARVRIPTQSNLEYSTHPWAASALRPLNLPVMVTPSHFLSGVGWRPQRCAYHSAFVCVLLRTQNRVCFLPLPPL